MSTNLIQTPLNMLSVVYDWCGNEADRLTRRCCNFEMRTISQQTYANRQVQRI